MVAAVKCLAPSGYFDPQSALPWLAPHWSWVWGGECHRFLRSSLGLEWTCWSDLRHAAQPRLETPGG